MGGCSGPGAAAELQNFNVGLKVLARDLQLFLVPSLILDGLPRILVRKLVPKCCFAIHLLDPSGGGLDGNHIRVEKDHRSVP